MLRGLILRHDSCIYHAFVSLRLPKVKKGERMNRLGSKLVLIMIIAISGFFAGCKNPFPEESTAYDVEFKKTDTFDYIDVFFKMNSEYLSAYNAYKNNLIFGSQIDTADGQSSYEQNVTCEVLDQQTLDSKCQIVITGLDPLEKGKESITFNIAGNLDDASCESFKTTYSADNCVFVSPNLSVSNGSVTGAEVVIKFDSIKEAKVDYCTLYPFANTCESTLSPEALDEAKKINCQSKPNSKDCKAYIEAACNKDPTLDQCDYDLDGVINKYDSCKDEPELYDSDGKTPLDAQLDGCSTSVGAQGAGNATNNSGGYLVGKSGCSLCVNEMRGSANFTALLLILSVLAVINIGRRICLARVRVKSKKGNV